MATVRMRRDVWKLATWDPILFWYAKAVTAMKARPLTDPTSWRYQAAIHEYNRSHDPFAAPGDSLPPAAERQKYWNQCQHNSWFFLSWHRMYLACFERIVADTIVALGGPPGWALPYWNYSDDSNSDARRLPRAFREATLSDGTPNDLLVAARNPGCNTGQVIANDVHVA